MEPEAEEVRRTKSDLPDWIYSKRRHFENIEKHVASASKPLVTDDKAYEIRRQRGQISGLYEALSGYASKTSQKGDYRAGHTDIAPRWGYSGMKIPSIDYLVGNAGHAQHPAYVPKASQAYSLEGEYANQERK